MLLSYSPVLSSHLAFAAIVLIYWYMFCLLLARSDYMYAVLCLMLLIKENAVEASDQ
jgi:hypothetical protein